MTVRFFRVSVIGTDYAKLSTIKTWFESEIDVNDIVLGGTTVYLYEDIFNLGTYTLGSDLYLNMSVDINKYTDKISNMSNQLDKQGITSIKVIQYDSCSHDSDNPQPCVPTVRMEWSSN